MAKSPPNIVLIMADQLAPQFTGTYGHPVVKTPAMSALAARGTAAARELGSLASTNAHGRVPSPESIASTTPGEKWRMPWKETMSQNEGLRRCHMPLKKRAAQRGH